MKKEQVLFLAAGILETVLGFPMIGGTIILGLVWTPLIIGLGVHIIALVFATTAKPKQQITGSILGILANTVGLIPVVGMILHILAAIFNYIQAFNPVKK